MLNFTSSVILNTRFTNSNMDFSTLRVDNFREWLKDNKVSRTVFREEDIPTIVKEVLENL